MQREFKYCWQWAKKKGHERHSELLPHIKAGLVKSQSLTSDFQSSTLGLLFLWVFFLHSFKVSLKEEEEKYLPGSIAKTITVLSWYCNIPTSV